MLLTSYMILFLYINVPKYSVFYFVKYADNCHNNNERYSKNRFKILESLHSRTKEKMSISALHCKLNSSCVLVIHKNILPILASPLSGYWS